MEHPLIQTWNLGYIGLSYVIATLTSFVSLELAGRAGRDRNIGSNHFWQIAQALFLSPKTVRNNVSNIFAKLQVADRAEAIVRARDAGLGRA